MAEHTTVFITNTTPGVGTWTYTESGRKTSMDVDNLTVNTEYVATAEYERPDGVTIQTVQGVTFRTLVAGTFTVSNEQWINNNDGLSSTVTFNFTSTYAVSSIILQDNGVSGGPQYQCTISGNTGTATLPYYSPGTQHSMVFLMTDIYAETANIGRILALQTSVSSIPLYFEADNPSNPVYVSLTRTGSPTSLTMQTSFDNSSWSNYTLGNSIELNESHPRVYFRNSGSTLFSTGQSNYYKFNTTTNDVSVGGNIASLKSSDMSNITSNQYDFYRLFEDNIKITRINNLYLGNYTTLTSSCYANMFRGCTSITTIPSSLPATTLAWGCYEFMFGGCTSLSSIPNNFLPATTLANANNCYANMFWECTSLTTTPSLPATTLAGSCYIQMFYGCTSLRSTSILPATTLSTMCYRSMFSGCTSLVSVPSNMIQATTIDTYSCNSMFSGCTSLENGPDLPATSIAAYCYQAMFSGCTSLTTAPDLPATTLANRCYERMFEDCTSLENGPDIQATTLAQYCCSHMFDYCTNLLTAPDLPSTTLAPYCYYYMFNYCTSLRAAPKLTAARLVDHCYDKMFYYCSSLEEITCLAEDISATDCVARWVEGVASNGIFYKSSNMSSWSTGTSGIPRDWTVVDYQN